MVNYFHTSWNTLVYATNLLKDMGMGKEKLVKILILVWMSSIDKSEAHQGIETSWN